MDSTYHCQGRFFLTLLDKLGIIFCPENYSVNHSLQMVWSPWSGRFTVCTAYNVSLSQLIYNRLDSRAASTPYRLRFILLPHCHCHCTCIVYLLLKRGKSPKMCTLFCTVRLKKKKKFFWTFCAFWIFSESKLSTLFLMGFFNTRFAFTDLSCCKIAWINLQRSSKMS